MSRLARFALLLAALVAAAAPAAAQSLNATQIYLGATPCRILSGSGSPEGAVTAAVCSVYLRTSDGSIYRKATGAGNTGWVLDSFTDPLGVARGGSGRTTLTSNGVLYGAGTSALGMTSQGAANSLLAGNGGVPSFTTTPTVTSLTATGNVGAATITSTSTIAATTTVSGASVTASGTVTGTTSVSTPTLTAAANLTISPAGDLLLNPTGNDVLPTTGYDINLGSLTAKYLTLHAAELWVSTLVAQDVMATIGGRVVVAPTTQLAADLTNVATSIVVKHNQIASGDRLVLESGGQVEWIAATSGPSGGGPYTYTVTRNLDGSGANTWSAGDAVMNTGTTADGYLDIYADNGLLPGSTVGPTMVGNVRTGTTYSDIEPRWAIGNLNGLYGYGADTYGAAFGTPTAAWVKIDPTNGVRLGHNSTTSVQIDASGNASFTGAITAASGAIGGWTIGAATLSASSGTVGMSSTVTGGDDIRFWAGDATPGSAEFRVTEAGALTATSGTIGGWTLGASSLTATNLGIYSGAANTARVEVGSGSDLAGLNSCSTGTGISFWSGDTHANRATAPFRVDCDGDLTGTSATFTSPDITLGVSSAYVAATALKFARDTSIGFGQAGDIFGSYATTVGSTHVLELTNKLVGNATSSGTATTGLFAQGWSNSGTPAATPLARVQATSSPGVSRVLFSTTTTGGTTRTVQFDLGATLSPTSDNTISLGNASNQWSAAYSESYYSGTTQGLTDTCNGTLPLTVSDGLMTACTSTSDERAKDFSAWGRGLDAIRAINPIRYTYKPEYVGFELGGIPGEFVGFSAQNLQTVLPEMVDTDSRGLLRVPYTQPLIAALVNAVKELAAEVDALKERVGR